MSAVTGGYIRGTIRPPWSYPARPCFSSNSTSLDQQPGRGPADPDHNKVGPQANTAQGKATPISSIRQVGETDLKLLDWRRRSCRGRGVRLRFKQDEEVGPKLDA